MKKIVKIVALIVMVVAMGFCVSTAIKPVDTQTVVYAAVLQQGNSGSSVKTMQQKLKNWGYYKGAIDGIFGPKTLEAVKYFQKKTAGRCFYASTDSIIFFTLVLYSINLCCFRRNEVDTRTS